MRRAPHFAQLGAFDGGTAFHPISSEAVAPAQWRRGESTPRASRRRADVARPPGCKNGAAVTEIASLRAALSGPLQG